MVSFKEALGSHVLSEVPIAHQQNIQELLKRVNVLRAAWGRPMIVTSGYRSLQEHLNIYFKKGITDRKKIPMGSAHLTGQAIDIYDPGLKLTAWLKENDSSRLIEVDLYCEEGNSNWVHFTTRRPGSGRRWFLP